MQLLYGKTPIPVLFENSSCLVLNKPAGLPVQGGEGVKVSLDSILSANYDPRPLLVHRLDRDTSGLILVAKTKEAAGGFSALFSGRSFAGGNAAGEKGKAIVKQYLGVCSGIPGQEALNGKAAEKSSGVIRLSLDIRGKERESETFYQILSSGIGGDFSFSLLELELGTGRMHQIRRHLALTGNPLLGDDKYGDFSLNKKLRKISGLKHLLLHASRLIILPLPGLVPAGLDIQSPLPDYFSGFLDKEALTDSPLFP